MRVLFRSIAIDTGLSKTEEFLEFTEFWLERSPEGIVTVYALLDGPSVTGAYRFVNRQGTDEMTQDISAVIHLRDAVERLGIAPQTSMFWYGEGRSEEHTSELQSLMRISYAVFCLKKKQLHSINQHRTTVN